MTKVWIYGLADPNTEEIRYVGKAVDPEKRYRSHLSTKPALHRYYWIRSLLRQDQRPVLIHLERVASTAWQAAERKWIKYFREEKKWSLTNLTDGGDGLPKGYKMSEEAKRRMSLSHLGKHSTEIAKRKISAALRGRCFSEEAKHKISLALKGKSFSEITRQKMSTFQKKRFANPENHPMLGKRHSEVTKRRLSIAHSGKHHTEEAKRKMSLAHLGKHLSEETKHKISLARKSKQNRSTRGICK